MKISDIKVYCLKPFGEIRNSNSWEVKKNTFNFVRLMTDEGIDGWSVSSLTGGNAKFLESSIGWMRNLLVGQDPLDREKIFYELNFTGSFFRINRFFNSAIDIALWDIGGKAAGVPIFKLIGGFRDRIRAYASSLAYPEIDDYLKEIDLCRKAGFSAYKLHGFNDPRKDIDLCEAARSRFPDMDLMLDALCSYDRKGALEVGRVLDRLGFYWYESPLREEDLEGHALLRRKLDVPIAATELEQIGFLGYSKYIEHQSVDIVRTFGDYIGGITPMIKTAHLCHAHHLKLEPHSFGPTLVQAAHFHIMLAIHNCDFFESPVPEGVFDAGMKDVIRVGTDGFVVAPVKPGLGYEIDQGYIEKETDRIL
jgi:L-alanine-DL-glutamate epimerase-like enolase superfamily enzyme